MLFGLYIFFLLRWEVQTERELGEQLLTLAQPQQNPALLLSAHRALGDALFWLGEAAAARAHLEQGIALYNPQQHRSLAFLYGDDPGVDCLAYAAWALWWLGYPDQALQSIAAALTLARQLAHPPSLARALGSAAFLHQFRREGRAAQEQAETAIAFTTEQGIPIWTAVGTILQGWALAEQGRSVEGIAEIHQGLAVYRDTGAETVRPYWLTLLAEGYAKLGRLEDGLSALTEALTAAYNTGERWWEAELYRLKGELSLRLDDPSRTLPAAEEYFLQAFDIARRQSAKSLELRAAMSLARLWQRQGKRAEAHELLVPIYGWFTEGFETADLQEAKTLLDELAR